MKACDKTNVDRNVIPKASKNSFQNPNSAMVRHRPSITLFPANPFRTFVRVAMVEFGAPPKIFFFHFSTFVSKISNAFGIMLLSSFVLSHTFGTWRLFSFIFYLVKKPCVEFQKFHEFISCQRRGRVVQVTL